VNPGLPATVSGRYLSFVERENLALWRAQNVTVREIATRLGRSPSTISRELRRNASTRITAWTTRRRPRSGMRSGALGDRRSRGWSLTTDCASTSRTDWPA
jgi:IS30 family transposase